MKRFKKKKKFKFNIIYIFIIILFVFCFKYILNIRISSNKTFITTLLNDTNSYIKKEKNNIFLKTIFSMEEPLRVSNIDNELFIFNKKELPRVYIYSTHDEEEFLSDYKEGYDLSPNIIAASYLLQEELNKKGILTIVEDRLVSKYRKENNLNFYDSYKISRKFLLETINMYPNLDLIIDLHRDALNRNQTFLTYNNNDYAKILFVIGKKYNTYESNLELANKLNEKLNIKVPSISKGIMFKDKEEQNGVYNQDVNKNVILLELGSNNNTVNEIVNSISIISDAIKEVLNENQT